MAACINVYQILANVPLEKLLYTVNEINKKAYILSLFQDSKEHLGNKIRDNRKTLFLDATKSHYE